MLYITSGGLVDKNGVQTSIDNIKSMVAIAPNKSDAMPTYIQQMVNDFHFGYKCSYWIDNEIDNIKKWSKLFDATFVVEQEDIQQGKPFRFYKLTNDAGWVMQIAVI